MGKIRKVGVIGSGVMGSGIAAHLSNAGIRSVLLDIVPPGLDDGERDDPRARNRLAEQGLKRAVKSKPALFFHRSGADLVRTGNLEDHFDLLKDCDLIIEAIIERLDIKRNLFERLESTVQPGTVVASNTSGLRIEDMLQGRGEAFRKHFLVMHFFNPVRYMKLLELVRGPETDDRVVRRVEAFGRELLGKGIVHGKDTPNFVGNRIGAHSLMVTIHEMLAQNLGPEDVDNITGPAMAHPKTASFRTADLVGLDTFAHVVDNCHEVLVDDEDREVFRIPEFIRTMLNNKLLGNKTKGGFYKKTKDGIQVFDPKDQAYRDKKADENIRSSTKAIAKLDDPAERLRQLVGQEGIVGSFAWAVLSKSLAYAARRVGEIADSVEAIDDAMRWGYNWDLGPFEVWDALGFQDTTARMLKEGIALPDSVRAMHDAGVQGFYQGDTVYDLKARDHVRRELDAREVKLSVLRKGDGPVLSNDGAEAWDLGDGVLGVTFKTKANSIDGDVISLLSDAVTRAEQDFEGMLITNEGEHFCVGANLFAIVMAANQQQWDAISDVVLNLQSTLQKMKYAQVPVVAAPYGMTLGGGLEICLASDAVQAAAETYTGLVEVAVGVIPGGCGNMNLLWKAMEGLPDGAKINVYELVTQVFKNIAMASVATSAVEAKHFGYFRPSDGVSFDRARHLHEAKMRVIGLARAGYHAPSPRQYRLPGESGMATLGMMVDTLVSGNYASEHDALISRKLAAVLCGGVSGAAEDVTEERILELEREAFVSLCGEPKSIERMQHMLMNNKPLRN